MSAVDRRRFNGPEDSHPIRLLNKGKGKLEVLDEETGLRNDGRQPEELRPICKVVDWSLIT